MARIKKNLKAPAIKAIRKMIAFVLANPKLLDQNNFPNTNDCGSACCAAGHLIAQNDPGRYFELCNLAEKGQSSPQWEREAAKVLDIQSAESAADDADLPFDRPDGREGYRAIFGTVNGWPFKFTLAYNNAKTSKGRARAFANRWENFIATDGAGIEYAK